MNRNDLATVLEGLLAKSVDGRTTLSELLAKGAGESVADILRHDKGHDDWHAAHGDPPCKSEADCASMRAKYDAVGGK